MYNGGGFMVGGRAESALFSDGVAEFGENLDGITEIGFSDGDGKLDNFSAEKRNLAKKIAEFRNW